jgi:hypothetical protein
MLPQREKEKHHPVYTSRWCHFSSEDRNYVLFDFQQVANLNGNHSASIKRKRKTPTRLHVLVVSHLRTRKQLLFNLEQVANPSEVLHLNGIHNTSIKRKRKTPLRLKNLGGVFKQR